MKKLKVMESETVFKFKTNDFVHGFVVNLIDNIPYSKLIVNVWFDNLYTGQFEIPHFANIDNDHLGRSTSIFKTYFRPFKTTGTIKVKIKTNLLYDDDDGISMNLLTK